MEKLNREKEILNNEIKSLIYFVRGKQVILDSDVAMLYNYETKNINKAMKRNIERFPEDFCFRLTKEELNKMWCQNGTTLNKNSMKYRSEEYLPYVYTEQGVSMLAGILKNNTAIQVSIRIIRAFIEMRKFINANAHVFERLTKVEYKLSENDKKFDILFDKLQHEENIKEKIFFEGQIYDAYNIIINLIKKAKEKIIIIDNYIDDSTLKMLTKKNKNVEVLILTSNRSNIQKLDVQKFNEEYNELKVYRTEKFHDRFMIIDDNELYHCGASLKDLGKKCFAISRIEDNEILQLIKKIFDNKNMYKNTIITNNNKK